MKKSASVLIFFGIIFSCNKKPDETILMQQQKAVKQNFNQAFNEKGNGFRETWFYNLPLLSLDHIWVSKDLKVLKTKKINTFKSDHNMIKTYIKK